MTKKAAGLPTVEEWKSAADRVDDEFLLYELLGIADAVNAPQEIIDYINSKARTAQKES